MDIKHDLKIMGKGFFLIMFAHYLNISIYDFYKISLDPYYKRKLKIFNSIKENERLYDYYSYILEHLNFGIRYQPLFYGSINLKELVDEIEEVIKVKEES